MNASKKESVTFMFKAAVLLEEDFFKVNFKCFLAF